MIYKDTEKTYCDKLNSEKTIKKPTKKRTNKWRVVSSEVCCIECNVEIDAIQNKKSNLQSEVGRLQEKKETHTAPQNNNANNLLR